MNLPKLDYYHGRQVLGVEPVEGEDGQWDILLDGDIRIRSYNPLYPMPMDEEGNSPIIGLVLQRTIYDDNGTALFFGSQQNPGAARVNFEPDNYGIRDPRYGEEFVNAQMDSAGRVMTPAEPEGRTATGPSEDYQRDQDALLAAQEAAGDDASEEPVQEGHQVLDSTGNVPQEDES